MLWTIITAIIGGLIIGALARLVLPGTQPIGMLWTILLGVAGSLIGSWLCWKVFDYQNENGGWQVIPFIVGVAVAAVLIWGYVMIAKRGARSGPRV